MYFYFTWLYIARSNNRRKRAMPFRVLTCIATLRYYASIEKAILQEMSKPISFPYSTSIIHSAHPRTYIAIQDRHDKPIHFQIF